MHRPLHGIVVVALLALLQACAPPTDSASEENQVPVTNEIEDPTPALLAGTWSGTMFSYEDVVVVIHDIGGGDTIVFQGPGYYVLTARVTWTVGGGYLRSVTKAAYWENGDPASTDYSEEKGTYETAGRRVTASVTATRTSSEPFSDDSGWVDSDEPVVRSWTALLDGGRLYGATEYNAPYGPVGAVDGLIGSWERLSSNSSLDPANHKNVLSFNDSGTVREDVYESSTDVFPDTPNVDSYEGQFTAANGELEMSFASPHLPYRVTGDYLSIARYEGDAAAGGFLRQ